MLPLSSSSDRSYATIRKRFANGKRSFTQRNKNLFGLSTLVNDSATIHDGHCSFFVRAIFQSSSFVPGCSRQAGRGHSAMNSS